MAYDFVTGELSPAPHLMAAAQVFGTVGELKHGQSGFVDQSAWWVDLAKETWINAHHPMLRERDMPIKIAQSVAEHAEANNIELTGDEKVKVELPVVRIVRVILPELVLDGVVMDASDSDFVANGDIGEKLVRSEGPDYDYSFKSIPVKRLPVLAWFGNKAELEAAEPSLAEKYGVTFGKTFAAIVEEYNNSH